jgi:hypothetical protein
MARAFISYSSKSKELVEGLVQDIEAAGFQAWFDHKLTGGQAWWEQILTQIRECDLFVFALTPDALDSVPCEREYKYAHQIGKNILPVLLLDGVSVNLLPLELSVIQFVDYRHPDRQSGIRLISAINGLPPLKPLPDPLPPPPEVPISYIGNLKDQIEVPGGLTFDEQASLILQLKTLLQETDEPQDAIELLHRFKRRKDLLALIDKEIDALLAVAQGAPVPQPPAQSRPAVPEPTRPPARARSRQADPFAPQADPFATTAATSRPAPAQPAAQRQPARVERAQPRSSGAGQGVAWMPALLMAVIGWAICGLLISLPLFVLVLLLDYPDLYIGFFGRIIDGGFALVAGAVSGFVTLHALRSGFRYLDGSGMRSMMVWYAVASIPEVILQVVFNGGGILVTLIGLAITWAIVTWVTIAVLRPQVPGLNGRGVAIAWGVAHLLFFIVAQATQEMLYRADLSGFIFTVFVMNMVGNGLIGITGVGLTLRELQQHAAVPAPEGAD